MPHPLAAASAQAVHGVDAIVSGAGLFLALIMTVASVAIPLLLAWILWRGLRAHERLAAAAERIARSLESPPSRNPTDVER